MYYWISSGLQLLCCVIALILFKDIWFNSKKALFPKLVALGVACITLGSLNDVAYFIVRKTQFNGLYIGFFGIIGCFLSLLSVSYGQLDRLFDDSSKAFFKYRIISISAPIVVSALFVPVFMTSNLPMSMRIFAFLGWLPAIFASYYNLKHSILPDCGFVFVKAVRPYNITAVILEVSYTIHIVLRIYQLNIGILISSIVVSSSLIALLYFAKKGVAQWTI